MCVEEDDNMVPMRDLLEQEGLVPLEVALNDPNNQGEAGKCHWNVVSFDDPQHEGLSRIFQVGMDGNYYGRSKIKTNDGRVVRCTATTTCLLGVYEFKSALK